MAALQSNMKKNMQKTTKLMKTDEQQFIEIRFVSCTCMLKPTVHRQGVNTTIADERIQNDENLEHGAGGTERTQ